MKKYRWLLVLGVFALVLFVPILVQADVGNSFSGGSSGGDYGGGYSGGSGLGGIVFLGGGGDLSTIIIAIILVAAITYFRSKIGGARRPAPYRSSGQQRVCNEAKAIADVQAIDPDFSAESFKTYASEVYLTLQEAWEDRDWKKVRPFESNALFNVHDRQLQEYIEQHKTNHLDMQNVRNITIADFRSDGAHEVLSVKLEASLLDYVTDDESGKVLEGSKTQHQHRLLPGVHPQRRREDDGGQRTQRHELSQLRRTERSDQQRGMCVLPFHHHQRRFWLGIEQIYGLVRRRRTWV